MSDSARALWLLHESRRLVGNEIRRLMHRDEPEISARMIAENIRRRIDPEVDDDELMREAAERLNRRWGAGVRRRRWWTPPEAA
jgi:hypothetical protein